ncbi:Intraflagellar transport protein 20 -like protein [Echinococcus granulosus]|uniref:Intraflagellar transport protein 20 n=1 Tax=Echinococcus granulosus TaxID=6210 RepID=A0A068WTW5_ECHGR|nr:Intraflagellar transport protein 20 -like protein [Echinococcus granulosus]CDS21124.1 intraflagellar transport protein 20 [Echinococcus granulosus]
MAANLAKAGLYVDDFNKLRILDPSITQATADFKEECAGFINKTEEFQSVTKTVMELFETISTKVEKMKIKCICSRNQLESIDRKKREEQELLETRLLEARIECERLRLQLQSLENVEAEQKEFIQNFLRDR